MKVMLIVGGFAGLAVVAAAAWFFGSGERRIAFDAATWRDGGSNSTNAVRIQMVDDLLRRHTFRGMTREQVVDIAGPPDQTSYFKDWDMVYWLGPERGYARVDSEWLVFRLDDDQKVAEYKLVTD